MTIKLGIVMDPFESLTLYKDSTLAIVDEASKRGWETVYFTPQDLSTNGGIPYGKATPIRLGSSAQDYILEEPRLIPLPELDVILMRKDPPFNLNYVYSTQILSLAEHQGVKVYNAPQGLRDFNEKLFINLFPQCCTPTVVSSKAEVLETFWKEHGTIIVKPLDGMGGTGIFKLSPDSPNFHATCEILTENESVPIMAQRFIPEITAGDKRILLIDGEPVPYALARIPKEGEIRGNLAAGGQGVSQPLSDQDRWICEQVGPTLKENDLLFVGIDIIGNYLTEINVTSPTCIRELDEQNQINISAQLLDAITNKIHS